VPAIDKYYPPNAQERLAFNSRLTTERHQRQAEYRESLRYYEGDHPEPLEPFRSDDEPDDNVRVNLIKQACDRTASFLFSDYPQVRLSSDPGETEEEEFIRKFFKSNNALSMFTKWAMRGFLAGHTFIRIHPPRSFEKYPRLSLLPPASVTTFWRIDDPSDVVWYEQRYYSGEHIIVRDFVPDYPNKRWLILTYKSQDRRQNSFGLSVETAHGFEWNYQSEYELYSDTARFEDTPERLIHTSVIPPLLETPHLPDPNNYYGKPEVDEDNKRLQNNVNRLWSLINRTARTNASPTDVVTGTDIEEIQTGDDIFVFPNPETKITRLEMRSDLRALSDTADKLSATLLANMRVVILKGEAKDLQRVTNAAVRTLFIDMLAKNRVLQSNYESTLVAMVKLALSMTKHTKDYEPEIIWPNPLPTDMTEEANINALALAGGYMSLSGAAERLDRNWTEEREQIEREKEWKFGLAQKYQLPEEGGVDEENHASNNPQANVPQPGQTPPSE
jgi:hypothetical protein